MAKPKLILASTSKYRQQQLSSLGFEFTLQKEPVNESPLIDESPEQLAKRLACEKAQAVALKHPDAIVIGADQVASIDKDLIGKPGTKSNAIAQLKRASGKTMRLYTAFALFTKDTKIAAAVETVEITFRTLSEREIRNYVELDQPLDCAGSFKSESRGSMLFDQVRSSDPSAIIGLPLIALARSLREVGLNPLS